MDKSQIKFLDEHVYEEIFIKNVYSLSREEIAGKGVLDLGGQYGMFALFCAEAQAKQIVSVEPNFENLYKYIENTKHTNARVVCAAAAYTAKTITTISNTGGTSTIEHGTQLAVTTSLFDLVKLFDSQLELLLKIDIEGSEYSLLYNTPPPLIKKFKYIVMEAHNFDPMGRGNEAEKLKIYLSGLGFEAIMLAKSWRSDYSGPVPFGYMYKFVRK